jgi:NTE family protein
MSASCARSSWRAAFLCLLGAAVLAGCAYPTRNEPASNLAANSGYRWSKLKDAADASTLVIVSASGGGTRAATLEMSVLRAMAQIRLPAGGTLADGIDMLSSVSGGSVTAAYFALHGTQGLAELERRFIRQDGIRALLLSGLNPAGLTRLSTPAAERIDVLIDYLDDTLFTRGETYADLLALGKRPYLILNAADMVEGVPFPFTQNNFDLLCSDLAQMKLSTAVAASAAFPVALSPLTLTNYSPCPAQQALPAWPPAWAQADAGAAWLDNPERASRGRVQLAYAAGNAAAAPKAYLHLLDGGITDNLGVAEPYRVLTGDGAPPQFLTAIAQGDIQRIVFIMINARSFAPSSLDQDPATPGIIDMLMASINSSIDRASAGAAQKLRSALNDAFVRAADDIQAAQPGMAARLRTMPQRTHLLEIDFDAIEDPVCRRYFHSIGTSWNNSSEQIDNLLKIGGALLADHPRFPAMLQTLQARLDGALPSTQAVCATVNNP